MAKYTEKKKEKEMKTKQFLQEIPMSIEEKSKYGYGYDINRFKMDGNPHLKQ